MKLRKSELRGYEELTEWIVISAGEGHFHYASKEEAVAGAKDQSEGAPGLVLGLYRLEHYVSSRVQAPQLFEREPSK